MTDLTKYYIDLSTCSEEQVRMLNQIINIDINRISEFPLLFCFETKWDQAKKGDKFHIYGKTELSYYEFVGMFECGEGKSNGWIKVTESLPNRNDVVLTLTHYGKMDVCIFKEKDYWLNDIRPQHSTRGIVAWMRLPETPKF